MMTTNKDQGGKRDEMMRAFAVCEFVRFILEMTSTVSERILFVSDIHEGETKA